MRIIIQNPNEQDIRLYIPAGLVLNRFTALFTARFLRKYGLNLTGRQLARLVGELNAFKRRRKDWKLVEVESADGEYIEIQM